MATAAEIEAIVDGLLLPDDWKRAVSAHISGRPIFNPAVYYQVMVLGCAEGFAHHVAARVDSAYISGQDTLMEEAVESGPELAIGTAKEFIENHL